MMENATNRPTPTDASVVPTAEQMPTAQPSVASVEASACCGSCEGASKEFVYAIGELQYDFPSVLRESSVEQHIAPLKSVPGHRPQARNSLDFLRHLFGYKEVFVKRMKIGDIHEIEMMPSSVKKAYLLTIEKGTSCNLSFAIGTEAVLQKTKIGVNDTPEDIDKKLTNTEGIKGKLTVTVTKVNTSDAGQVKHFLIVLESYKTNKEPKFGDLRVDRESSATVNEISLLKVTVSDDSDVIEEGDVGRQIGFNGLNVGDAKHGRQSVLNSCNSMIIRHFEDWNEAAVKKKEWKKVGKKVQSIYVETDRLDGDVTLILNEANYYIPQACEVTHEHGSNMYDASAVIWKLNRGKLEVYGIVPDGNFAEDAYRELAEFHMNQCGWTATGLNYFYYEKAGRYLAWEFGWDPRFNERKNDLGQARIDGSGTFTTTAETLVQDRSERVAIPGVLQGEVQLITGVRLPAIKPDMRGTSEWSEAAMLRILLDAFRHSSGEELSEDEKEIASDKIRALLQRLDDSVRNPGLSPEDRALNHAATNLFGVIGKVAAELMGQRQVGDLKDYELDDILVKRSEIGYAGSDCWDVEVSFFNTANREDTLLVVSQTIDVNDTIPALTDKPRKFRRR